MFNWNPSKDVQESKEAALKAIIFNLEAGQKKIEEAFTRERGDMWKAIKDLTERAEKPVEAPDLKKLTERVTELELSWAKLHAMLTERSLNTGKEKLSKMGTTVSKFYGK